MTDPAIAVYYDRLARWTGVARAFGYGGGRASLTVHRPLAAGPEDAPTTTRLHDVLLASLPPLAHPRVLDAGCGLGGTMLDLERRLGGTYVGLTLSPVQASTAARAADRAGVGSRVRADVRSYDEPPAGPFDLVVAIESLAHSPSPDRSVTALFGALAPGGLFVIVDDMPEPAAAGSLDLATFKAGWRCPVLWSAAAYRDRFAALGAEIVVDRDLTSESRPRPLARIARLERFNRLLHRVIPWSGWRAIMDSHRGGLALERLTRSGLVRYRLLVARARP